MKKLVFVLATACAINAGLALSLVAEEETVNTTVTPLVISIRIMEANPPAYGNVTVGTLGAKPTPDSFTVENNGTEIVDLDIMGANSNNGWTLSTTSAGQDAYVHYFWTGVQPETWKKLSSSQSEVLKLGLLSGQQQSVLLKLDMPTGTSNTGQHILPVKVMASLAE